MAEQKKAEPLTEAQVRAIVREEMAVLANWQHDADHGSVQARRAAQRQRDIAAALDAG